MVDPRVVLAEDSATSRKRFDIRYSIMHRGIPLVRKPDSPRLPTASEALASVSGAGWNVAARFGADRLAALSSLDQSVSRILLPPRNLVRRGVGRRYRLIRRSRGQDRRLGGQRIGWRAGD